MKKGRLEAFSDGVLAIAITIMVLELKVPHSAEFSALQKLWPVFISYVLSFIYVGIYWNNHHHMLSTVQKVNGAVLWANMHLLFWLSIVPFTTGWMGENHFAPVPTAVYGFVLLMAGIAYWILAHTLVRLNGHDSVLARAMGRDTKGRISPIIYLIAIPLALVSPWISWVLYACVALMWLIPDRRIERQLTGEESE
ncbi:DUF1211 domain-containing protein [bacterium]|nr:MAG: DUF1211 domain-containing protein [bacterium]